jgi:hypothetical protein
MVPDHVYAELQSDHDEALLRIGDLERLLHELETSYWCWVETGDAGDLARAVKMDNPYVRP